MAQLGSQEAPTKNGMRIVKWLAVSVAALLLLVACSKPLYDAIRKPHEQRWERALHIEARKPLLGSAVEESRNEREARDFGKELDVLTSFYETVISILLAVVAVVAGLAFWTIKVVTRAQAEETATEAATRILGDHEGFRRRLNEVVEEAVELRMEEVNSKLEEFSVPLDLVVQNPQQAVKPEKSRPAPAKKAAKKSQKKAEDK
ncbi:hypothetical protein FB548_0424 [Pseudoxanthomonas sp. 3HH-4]|uniref:hypothetical protein n=1 Tax=Pseudoxanthomonas sp. 3HH-4 TaxID=1690214 RepID=UPI0011505B52|nr:hypothetical protein [Pseudoxanthomonas sp. 3HH-4]TQM17056.1 hypothetical protein FB548_0424 [Pseudoxanthomonas sp. 3HH-4]